MRRRRGEGEREGGGEREREGGGEREREGGEVKVGCVQFAKSNGPRLKLSFAAETIRVNVASLCVFKCFLKSQLRDN